MSALEGILVPLYDASGECRWLNGPPDAIGEWSTIEDFDGDKRDLLASLESGSCKATKARLIFEDSHIVSIEF